MKLGSSISCVYQVACAFFGREEPDNVADGEANSIDGSGGGFSEEVLEFGEDQGEPALWIVDGEKGAHLRVLLAHRPGAVDRRLYLLFDAKELLDAILSGWTLADTKVAPLQDWQKGRRGEVDDINGLVVCGQKELGGRAPVNEKLVELAHQVERGELTPDPANAATLRSLLNGGDGGSSFARADAAL